MKKLLVAAVLLASSSVFALEYTNAVRGRIDQVTLLESASLQFRQVETCDYLLRKSHS